MFGTKPAEGGGIPAMAWGVAGLAVLVVLGLLVVMGRHKTTAPTIPAAAGGWKRRACHCRRSR